MQGSAKRLQQFDVAYGSTARSSNALKDVGANQDGGKKLHLTSTVTQYPALTNYNHDDRPWQINSVGGMNAISQNIPMVGRRMPSVRDNNNKSKRGQFIIDNGGSTFEHLPGTSDINRLVTASSHNLNATIQDALNTGVYYDQLTGRSRAALKDYAMVPNDEGNYIVRWNANTVAGASGTDMVSMNPSFNKDRDLFLLGGGTQNPDREAAKAVHAGRARVNNDERVLNKNQVKTTKKLARKINQNTKY
jgi:hypothetical protein